MSGPVVDEAVMSHARAVRVRGTTSYASASWLLRTEIERDIEQFKADGCSVFRPAVFFLTDGMPTDEPAVWRDAFADLTRWDKATQPGRPLLIEVLAPGRWRVGT